MDVYVIFFVLGYDVEFGDVWVVDVCVLDEGEVGDDFCVIKESIDGGYFVVVIYFFILCFLGNDM